MNFSAYHFITRWQIPGNCETIFDILAEPLELVRWWPEVYLDVQEIDPTEPEGLGKRFDLYTKGWLPYTLRWQLMTTRVERPVYLGLSAMGDFEGTGLWTLTQRGEMVDVEYDWRIEANKPLLRFLSPILKPVFAANHRWAMAKGETALEREVERLIAQR